MSAFRLVPRNSPSRTDRPTPSEGECPAALVPRRYISRAEGMGGAHRYEKENKMFNPTTRYTTWGIANTLPEEIAAQMWLSVDTQLGFGRTLDYLQIFKTEKVDDCVLAIHHQQEMNGKTETLTVLYSAYKPEYDTVLGKTVYIIDDGDHSTMLFADEY